MKDLLKDIFGLFIRWSGIFFVSREIFLRNKVTILFYHNPSKDVFRKHIEFLSKYYTFVTLDRLVDAVKAKNTKKLPPKSLVITFDDGFKENYTLLDLFKKYGIRPTIYLCSHVINTHRKLWFTVSMEDGIQLGRSTPPDLKKELNRIGYGRDKEYADRQMLNIGEILTMSPFVDFQSHSKFHPDLTDCGDEECRHEIEHSKLALEALLEKEIDHFSFPNGEYSEREIAFARESGYLSCRSSDLGWNDIHTDPNCLKALGVEDDATVHTLVGRITGIYGFFRFLRTGKISKIYSRLNKVGFARAEKEHRLRGMARGACAESTLRVRVRTGNCVPSRQKGKKHRVQGSEGPRGRVKKRLIGLLEFVGFIGFGGIAK